MLCFSCAVSFRQVSDSLQECIDNYLSAYDHGDGEIITSMPLDESLRSQILSLGGICGVRFRFLSDFSIFHDNAVDHTLRIVFTDTSCLSAYMIDGTLNDSGLLISASYARANNLNPGDTITLSFQGHTSSARISALVNTPQLLEYTRNDNGEFETTCFGSAYADYSLMKALTGTEGLANDILYTTDTSSDLSVVSNAVLDLIGRSNILFSQYGTDRTTMKTFDNDLHTIDAIGNVLPIIMYVLGLFFTVLFIRQFICLKRTQIGILLANGLSFWYVLWLFLAYALGAALAGILLGTGFSCVLAKLFVLLYTRSLIIPACPILLPWARLSGVSCISLAVSVLGVAANISILASIEPGECMRDAAPVTSPRNMHQKTFSRHVLLKASLSSVIRHPARFWLSCLCLILCTAIAIGCFAVRDSKNDLIQQTYDKNRAWDYMIHLQTTLDSDALDTIFSDLECRQLEYGLLFSEEISTGTASQTVTVGVLPLDSQLIPLYSSKEFPIALPQEGILIPQEFAHAHALSKGDFITMNGTSVEIIGLLHQSSSFTFYLSAKQYEQIYGAAPEYNCIYVSGSNDPDFLEQPSATDYVLDNSVLEKDARAKFSYIDQYILIILVVCILIVMLVIYNMSLLTFRERVRDFYIMRTLGLSRRFLMAGFLLETLVQCAAALIPGTVLGYFIAYLALSQLNNEFLYFYLVVNSSAILMTAAMLIIFSVVARLTAFAPIQNSDTNAPFI